MYCLCYQKDLNLVSKKKDKKLLKKTLKEAIYFYTHGFKFMLSEKTYI